MKFVANLKIYEGLGKNRIYSSRVTEAYDFKRSEISDIKSFSLYTINRLKQVVEELEMELMDRRKK